MKHQQIIFRTVLFTALILILSVQQLKAKKTPQKRPNIIVFFVDDMGIGELGCYKKSDLRTPNIDKIAERGIRCTSGYVTAPSCGPSRAGILSGIHQSRFGYEVNPEKQFRNSFGLKSDLPTLGNQLQKAGYKTGAFGKWDMGRKDKFDPLNRGFDFYYGHIIGARHYKPAPISGKPHVVVTRGHGKKVKETKYLTYQITDGAIEFLDSYGDDPFFMYIAYNAPHVPFEAPKAAIEANKHIKDTKRRTYAGMITALDNSVARIQAKLKSLSLEENTLIMFISDHGSPVSAKSCIGYVDGNNAPFRGGKGNLYEGGIRVPFIVQWTGGGLKQGVTYDRPVSTLDVMPTTMKLAGLDYSEKLEGTDILPYLHGLKVGKDPTDAFYWRYKTSRAVRQGDWKWIVDAKSKEKSLFNLAQDKEEKNNLIESNPEKSLALESLWEEWNKKNVAPSWQKPAIINKMKKEYKNDGMKPLK